MTTRDISVAFRLTDVTEVHYFNQRQSREQIVQKNIIQTNSITRATTIGASIPNSIVLQQSFPEHHLSLVPAFREEHAWGAVHAGAMPMCNVDPQRLLNTVQALLSESSPLSYAAAPRDAIAMTLAATLLMRYIQNGKDANLPVVIARARAVVEELAKPYDAGVIGLSPDADEARKLDGEGVNGFCPGIRFAERIFSGAYLAWFSVTPDASLMLWRAAVVDFLDSMPLPSGSVGDGFCNRVELNEMRATERLSLPLDFAPCNRGAHLCNAKSVFTVLCAFEDRILVQKGWRTQHGEFERGRKRADLLERLHPIGDGRVRRARVFVAPVPVFQHLPTFELTSELAAHGWLSAFRLALSNQQPIVFDRWLSISSVGDVRWETNDMTESQTAVLDRYTLFVVAALIFQACIENAGEELAPLVSMLVVTGDDLEFVMPEDGVRPEVIFCSKYLQGLKRSIKDYD